MKIIFDFQDYKEAVQKLKSSKLRMIEMKVISFNWKDKTLQFKLNKINPAHIYKKYKFNQYKIKFCNGKYTSFKTLLQKNEID